MGLQGVKQGQERSSTKGRAKESGCGRDGST